MIRLEEVTRVFDVGGRPLRALDGVTEHITPGEHVAIMGPSGSGKSTPSHSIWSWSGSRPRSRGKSRSAALVARLPHVGTRARWNRMARPAEDLRRLASELAALSPDDRGRVLGMLATGELPGVTPVRPVAWERLQRLSGLVDLGGHAAEDCEALYDA